MSVLVRSLFCGVVVAVAGLGAVERAAAQPMGTFTWQLQPYCNRVTVYVVATPAGYTLQGYDNQCGAPQRAPVTGIAVLNPDGTIGFGIDIISVPGGQPVHVDGRLHPANYHGTWTDSLGGQGGLAFNGNASGAARPLPVPITRYVFPGHNFAVNSIKSVVIPLSSVAVSTQSEWRVELVRTSGNVYPVPGPGLNGVSNYRVYSTPFSDRIEIYIVRVSGAGEDYSQVVVTRVPARVVPMP